MFPTCFLFWIRQEATRNSVRRPREADKVSVYENMVSNKSRSHADHVEDVLENVTNTKVGPQNDETVNSEQKMR